MNAQQMADKLIDAGFSAKIWSGKETRIYVRYNGKDLGYLTEDDDGSTGSCKHITRRAGAVAAALRQ